MTNDVAWVVLSFAVMVVAVLVRQSERIQTLERRLDSLEPPTRDHGLAGGAE